MVSNLRAMTVDPVSNTLLRISFTDSLVTNLTISNIALSSQTPGTPDPGVIKIRVIGKVLEVTTQPLSALAAYFIIFQSTDDVHFKSLNGDSVLLEDGVANKLLFLGPLEETNIIKNYLLLYLRDNVYNTEDGTIISGYLNLLSDFLSTALYDVRQAKNDNYLTTTIIDEKKTRGDGAFDHLNEEGAYQILRVGRTPTGATAEMDLSIDSFSSDEPITLLQKDGSENLTVNSLDSNGFFNFDTWTLNLSSYPVTKLSSVTFKYSNGHQDYSYDISSYGYQILDAKYDNEIAFPYATLKSNQIRISDRILNDVNFSTYAIFQIQVTYQFKDTGRVPDITTISVNNMETSGREVLPVLLNVFDLKHAPVVSADNVPGTIGDVFFVDQNVLAVLDVPHPAFKKELPYRLEFLPSSPGEYAIDYSVGRVYVFGIDSKQDGTGATPPLAIYTYRQEFSENIDWVIDDTDFVALETGSLDGSSGTISFNFEQVFAPDIDYSGEVHNEVLNQRIGNSLVALNALTVPNAPITNVFRIFNETSGEIYNISRWLNNKIFFTYRTPPKIQEFLGERASFENVSNEILFVNDVLATSNSSINIFEIDLANNNIIGQSEDCIGSIFNSSISLSDQDIFIQELYFDDNIELSVNLSRLTSLGSYLIDYSDGVVYAAVSSSQDFNIGSISYKRGYVIPINSHVTSIEDIYYRINSLSAKDKSFGYSDFGDGFILPTSFDLANEQILNEDSSAPYVLLNEQIGAFVDSDFVNTVSNNIQFIRSIFENDDLLNNTLPINFASVATFSNKAVSVDSLVRNEYHSVEMDGDGYFVVLNTGSNYLSPNITLDITISRLSDGYDLWNSSGSVVFGSLLRLTLPGVNDPNIGDSVLVTYSMTINDLSHIIIDYNKGEYYIDYSALTDEILVSYEYGSNALDFRQASTVISAGTDYYVSYKAGALRDALLKNFGSLLDIDELTSFNVDYPREHYRDALTAAFHTFPLGPTAQAIENIAGTISHMPATVKESAFDLWSLGASLLSPSPFVVTGNPSFVPVKYGNGIMLDQPNQTVTLPLIANLKLEEGTLETWVSPKWDGIDNLAELSIYPTKDGYVLPELEIFIGSLEYHPVYQVDDKGKSFFNLDKLQNVEGKPNQNKDGVYFYYDWDTTNQFKRWFIQVLDGYANDTSLTKKYSIDVKTNGKFYDVKSTVISQPGTSKITSGTNSLTFKVTSTFTNEGLTFISDVPHFIIDSAEAENKNRFSFFKDETGYLNFRIIDALNLTYMVSADVSSWKHGDIHHVAASWRLANKMGRDEIHLFIDGFEVPNIISYKSNIKPYLHEKFRTVDPEEIIGMVPKNIIAANDLKTTVSSNIVTSSLNFDQYGIAIGGTLFVEEVGFNSNGYSITNVNGNTLTLSSSMPKSITNGKFSVNKTMLEVATEIDIFPNFAVTTISSFLTGSDLVATDNLNTVSSATSDFAHVVPGDLLYIVDANFAGPYTIVSVSGNILALADEMPANLSGGTFYIYHNQEIEISGLRALNPSYEISKSSDGYFTNVLSLRNNVLANDLVLIRTLGVNHRKVKRQYYVWGNNSNILKTKLPIPLHLDEVKVTKVLLSPIHIGPSNATLVSGTFVSSNIITDPISNSAGGRTLSVNIYGDNVDWTSDTQVTISGLTIDGYGTISATNEVLNFSIPEIQETTYLFVQVNYIQVSSKPISSSRNACIINIKEKYPVTFLENLAFLSDSSNVLPEPIIRYSYQDGVGTTLSGDGYSVTDSNHFFSSSVVGNYLIVHQPMSAAGFYPITDVFPDHQSITVSSNDISLLPFAPFTDGYYEILNTTDDRSGLQSGYFTFEYKFLPGNPYYLTQGSYELEYYTALNIPFTTSGSNLFIGSDFNGDHQFQGALDELQILNTRLTDTRVGESVPGTQKTITKSWNSLKAAKPDVTTLVLAHFESEPLTNSADTYRFRDGQYLQAGESINDNFGHSISLIEKPITVDNSGILDVRKEGTIEFWVNPVFDAKNDPRHRYYFDAFGAVTENRVSLNNTTVTLTGSADSILHIYVAGSRVFDYAAGSSLLADGLTISLHKELPNQNTNIIVFYLPANLQGDRISLFKDEDAFFNFNIKASAQEYSIRAPIFWTRNSWHRIKASYTLNKGNGLDQMHLFIDGYERSNVVYANGLLYGQNQVYGSTYRGPNNLKYSLKFNDPINQFFIGSDYNQGHSAHCLIDNLRISNQSRPLYQPFGEPLDPNYSSNLSTIFPITEDLRTTLLLNFDDFLIKNTDFAVLNNKSTGTNDFSVTVSDAFDIINDDERTKNILESLIKSFKPANSRAFINYIG